MDKYKFTSVVAQDLLDSFLSFFPELKEQSVHCRAGEACARHTAGPAAGCGCDGGGLTVQEATSARRKLLGSSLLASAGWSWTVWASEREAMAAEGVCPSLMGPRGLPEGVALRPS